MSLFSRLFGGGAPKSQVSKREDYQGFAIAPEPAREGARFRVGARIEKEIGGTLKSHTLIRADTLEEEIRILLPETIRLREDHQISHFLAQIVAVVDGRGG